MKKRVSSLFLGVLLFLMSFQLNLNAQQTEVLWAKQAGGTGYDSSYELEMDDQGNVYMGGTFGGTVTFENNTYEDPGFFVSKHDAAGQLVWLKYGTIAPSIFPSITGALVMSVSLDPYGNVLITGWYGGTLTIESTVLPEENSTGMPGMFIAKYTNSGEFLWARYASGSYGIMGECVTSDNVGNCIVVGGYGHHNYSGDATFYWPGGSSSLPNFGGNQIFIAKYDPEGNLLWVKHAGSPSSYNGQDWSTGITLVDNNDFLITGSYTQTAVFGNLTLSPLSEDNSRDIFIAKYNSNGEEQWVVGAGGVGPDIGRSIINDSEGNIYLYGMFTNDITFGNTTLQSYDDLDGVLAKYDKYGNFVWVKQIGGPGTNNSSTKGLSITKNGNIMIGGSFDQYVLFGETMLSSNQNYCIFTALFNSDGNLLWAKNNGTNNIEELLGLVAIDDNTYYICGHFDGTGTFGNYSLTSYGNVDIFYLKVGLSNQPPEIISITAPLDPVSVGVNVVTEAIFTDPDINDTHISSWDWGDGSIENGIVNESSKTIIGNYSYSLPGVYTLKLKITDAAGESDEMQYKYIVVYDPNGGFITGGGWINSPEGAYKQDLSLSGKANFGFVAKYKKGSTIPGGNTEFQFNTADLNFKSSSYEDMRLVIAGSRANFKGKGTINGTGNYGFMVSAIDGQINGGGGIDKFRIKIWDLNYNGAIVYDNNIINTDDNAIPATALGGGSIVIHSDNPKSGEIESVTKNYSESLQPLVYPIPFSERLHFEYISPVDCKARIELYDVSGRLLKTVFNNQIEGGVNYKTEYIPSTDKAGIYFYRITLGENVYNGTVLYNR
jgi:hypothetical protein